MVIALDSPTDPQDATDALFATDNYKAGVLIGQYAKAALGGKPAKIATLDLFPGHPVGAQRHNGFLQGLRAAAPDAKSNELGKAARDRLHGRQLRRPGQGPDGDGELPAEEPRHQPRLHRSTSRPPPAPTRRSKRAGKDKGVIDRLGRRRLRRRARTSKAGAIAATSQQYPLKMASMGVAAGVDYAKTGKKVSGYTDTGVTLIADKPMAGVESKDTRSAPTCAGARSEVDGGLLASTRAHGDHHGMPSAATAC